MSDLKEQVLRAAAFDEHEAWRRCGYDSEKEPGVKHIIAGARSENLARVPLLTTLADCVGAADGDQFAQSYREDIASALAQLRQLLDSRGEK